MITTKARIVSDETFKKLAGILNPKLELVEVGLGRTSYECLYGDNIVYIRLSHAENLLSYVIDIEVPETYN